MYWMPEKLPEEFARLEMAYRRSRWQRLVRMVLVIATEGVSTAQELARTMQLGKKQIYRVLDSVKDLPESPLDSNLLYPGGKGRVRIVTLTDYGKRLARALGIEPVESDWEKIVRLHQGQEQTRHAALVLLAAYHARLRGWKAEVLPFDPQETPWFQPDLKITSPEGQFYYCEVETRSRVKPRKWARMRDVSLIVPTPAMRRYVTRRLKEKYIPGRATDLQTLMRQAKTGDLSQFWLERW